jgi:hypothetical protein
MYRPKEGSKVTGTDIFFAAGDGKGIGKKFLQPDGVPCSKPLPEPPYGVRSLFAATESEIPYEIADKANDLVDILQTDSEQKEKGWIELGIDWATGTEGAGRKLLSAIGSVAAKKHRSAIGFFPKGMPLDGGDPTNWEREARRRLQEMLHGDRLKSKTKGPDGACVYTDTLTDDDVEVLTAIAVIANDPTLFEHMILEHRTNGTWRLVVFANAGTTANDREKNARARLRQFRGRLEGLLNGQP